MYPFKKQNSANYYDIRQWESLAIYETYQKHKCKSRSEETI